jgi:hypothetical protein
LRAQETVATFPRTFRTWSSPLGAAAREKRTGVIFLLDEIQYLDSHELGALIVALHKCARRSLPDTLVAAGLPQIPRLAGEARSYSERLFQFPMIEGLAMDTAARDVLILPAEHLGVAHEEHAVDHIVQYTQGYPYFLQEYGKVLWDEAPESPITAGDALEVLPLVEGRWDEGFFRVRADRATNLELQYLYAMAQLGPEPQRASDVARAIHRTTEQAGPIRSRLIDKGLLYTPGHGYAGFTVPHFDRYLLRRRAQATENRPGTL